MAAQRSEAQARRGRRRRLALGGSIGLLAVLLLTGLAPSAARATPIAGGEVFELRPGQAFEVGFRFAADASVDVLVFALTRSPIDPADPPLPPPTGLLGYDVELWDEGALRGTHASASLVLWSFVSAGSSWPVNPLVVDLASIVDGTEDARLRLVPRFDPAVPGAVVDGLRFNPPPGTGLDLGTASGSFFTPAASPPVVFDMRITTLPEPALTALLLLAAGCIALRRAALR